VARLFTAQRPEIEAEGKAEVDIGGRNFCIGKDFLDDIEGRKLDGKIGALRRALLIFHSPRDSIVGIDNAERIFKAAKHPKSFVSLDHADHLLTGRSDAAWAANVLAAWAARYLEDATDEVAETEPRMQEGVVTVEEARQGRYRQAVRAGQHEMIADEPEDKGGDDAGPDPYGYLLAALGACTSMTLRMYAEHKEWPLEHVSVRLSHAKIHAEDCADCETKEGKIDEIQREIQVTGPLDEEQRAKLTEIANKCPVHRTLTSENKIRTKLV
jgi:putative redox protein